MYFLTLFELADILIMTIFLSLIFSAWFKGSFFEKCYKAALVAAPAILLHELAHKITALLFGIESPTFYAACSTSSFSGSGIGEPLSWTCLLMLSSVLLRFIGIGFIFFVPAFVTFSGGSSLALIFIAAAGPIINLILFLILRRRSEKLWILAARLNLFLFIFNILPIPGFDGWHILYNLLQLFI
jgi:Zn-dependent protease